MEFFREQNTLVKVVIFSAFLIVVIFLLHLFYFLFQSNENVEVSFLIFLATSILAFIAYREFDRGYKLTTNEFLLFISNRWGEKEIVEARQILHQLFVNIYRDAEGQKKSEYEEALTKISEQILEMSTKPNEEGNEFIYLLNLLDFLEILSYFFVRKDLDLNDILNICGHNINFLYKVFEKYIRRRQIYDKKSFNNFDCLFCDLRKNALQLIT